MGRRIGEIFTGNLVIEKDVLGFPGLTIIKPQKFEDSRGYFIESYNRRNLAEYGIITNIVQENQSYSNYYVLRGLHFQRQYPQTKIVRVVKGEVIDYIVDLRPNSPRYGEWFGTYLNDKNQKQMLVPKGFAHGFVVTSKEGAVFCYACDDYYHPEDEGGIIWNDPDINIPWWPNHCNFIISEKDKQWKTFKEQFGD